MGKIGSPKNKRRDRPPRPAEILLVSALTRVVDWRLHRRHKGWVLLEQLITGADLCLAPWLLHKHIPATTQAHPLIGATLNAFDKVCRMHSLSAKTCAITPLKGNPDFPPVMEQAYLAAEWPYPEMRAQHFFLRDRFLRQQELAAISNTKSFPFWAYIQIKHFLDNPANRDSFGKNPTVLESLCTGPSPQSHSILVLYAAMFGGTLRFSALGTHLLGNRTG